MKKDEAVPVSLRRRKPTFTFMAGFWTSDWTSKAATGDAFLPFPMK